MGGRDGVQPPGVLFHVGQGSLGGGRTGCHHLQGAYAVPVQAEILGTGVGDQHLRHCSGQGQYATGVGFQSVTQALVGEIHQRHEAPLHGHPGHLPPLLRAQVGAGGVVAAAVQQYHVLRPQSGQGLQHLLEQYAVTLVVVIRILLHGQAGLAQQRNMVGPGGSAQPEVGARLPAVDEFAGQAQGAGTARCGGRAGTAFLQGRMPGAQDQRLDVFAERRIAGDGGIGLGGFRLQTDCFRLLHRGEDGGVAVFGLVYAGAQVDLVWVGILDIGGGQAQDGVVRQFLE